MRSEPTESVPRRNPFNAQWRTDFPPFSDCLAALGTREDFQSFGEALTAASPPAARPRPRAEAFGPPNTSEDFSFVTLDVSRLTSPPPPLAHGAGSAATTPEQTPQRVLRSEENADFTTTTPREAPPLFPLVSPIPHSPLFGRPTPSAPRTEAQQVQPEQRTNAAEGKVEANLEHALRGAGETAYEWGGGYDRVETFTPNSYEMAEEGLGQWYAIRQRAERIVPPIADWANENTLTDSTYHVGDFAYHHPHVCRVPGGLDALFSFGSFT